MLRSQPPLPMSRVSVQFGFPMYFQVMEMSDFNMTSYAANGDPLHLLKWGIDAHRNKHSQSPKEKNYFGKCDNDMEWHWVLLLLKCRQMFFFLRWCAKYLPVFVSGKKEAIQWNFVLYLAAYFKTCFSTHTQKFQVKIQTYTGIQDAPHHLAYLPCLFVTCSLHIPPAPVNTGCLLCLQNTDSAKFK